MNRRTFLRRAGGVTLGLSLAPLLGCEDNLVTPLTEGTDLPFLTPVTAPDPSRAFFVQHGGAAAVPGWPGVPALSRAAWALRVDGLVDRPQTFGFEAVEDAMDEALTVLKTLRCVTDATTVPGLIGNALWTGVPLRRFLDAAGIDRTRTRRLRIYGADGFTNNLRIEQVYDVADGLFEPLLVYAMNGMPLTPEHGFPVRLLVADAYGFKNVKWIERIEATDSDDVFGSYQERLGFSDEATVRVVNKVTDPVRGAQVGVGPVSVSGYALSGFAGIERVEVAIDDGPFQDADLLPFADVLAANPELRAAWQVDRAGLAYPFPGVWALWSFPWMATPGTHTLRVRATDAAGNVQQERDFNPIDGFNPIFELQVTVS